MPKASEVGDTEKVDRTPEPDSVTSLVPAPPPVVTVRFATFEPVLVGLKFTLTVQVLPAVTDDPQLCVREN